MRALAKGEYGDAPPTAEVIKHRLRKNNLFCAQDLLNRAYRSPKQSIALEGEGPQLHIVLCENEEKPKPS